MKQLFTAIFLCLAILLTPGQPVLAAGEVDLYAQAEEQLAQSGIEELIPLIPEGGEAVAEDSALRRGDLSGWTLQSTLSWLWEVVWGEISAPFRLLKECLEQAPLLPLEEQEDGSWAAQGTCSGGAFRLWVDRESGKFLRLEVSQESFLVTFENLRFSLEGEGRP